MTSRSTRATPSRKRSACSDSSTLPSSARTPRLPPSAIVDLLVDVQIDAALAVAGPAQPVSASSESPPSIGALPAGAPGEFAQLAGPAPVLAAGRAAPGLAGLAQRRRL